MQKLDILLSLILIVLGIERLCSSRFYAGVILILFGLVIIILESVTIKDRKEIKKMVEAQQIGENIRNK